MLDETYQIINTLLRTKSKLKVMATVIQVEGSAYRKEGSSMLILEDETVGMISAGCLDEDVVGRAYEIWDSGIAKTIQYDLRDESDLHWGQGAGCNGVITVLLEPISEHMEQNMTATKKKMDKNQPVWLVKSLTQNLELLSNHYIFDDYDPLFIKLRPIFTKPQQAFYSYSGIQSFNGKLFYIHQFAPKPRLFIFGGGEDAVPIVKLAKQTGFSVTICDWRPSKCNMEKFPEADKILIGHPSNLVSTLNLLPTDFVLIMTHQFLKDQEIMNALKNFKLHYLGILGSKQRTDRLLRNSKTLTKIHSPVGLSIGAQGPSEIAVSIVAEMIQLLRNRNLEEHTS